MARFLTEKQQARQKEYMDLRTKVQGLREKVEPIKHECRMNRLMAEADKLTHFLERNAPDKLSEPIKKFDGPPGRDYRSLDDNHPINRTEECKCNRIDCYECFDRFDNTM